MSSNDSKSPTAARPDVPVTSLELLKDVEVEITLVEIGRRRLRIADILKLATGQTLELSKAAGEPLDIYVNGRLLGRGEAIVMGDRYAVRITEIVTPDGRSDWSRRLVATGLTLAAMALAPASSADPAPRPRTSRRRARRWRYAPPSRSIWRESRSTRPSAGSSSGSS